ncbi:hypothetical protein HNR65_003098 [Desulfosalsimonas propionicica]|uniref:Alkyl hydroperoxide reductase subunit C/ Thiol specific antioxidant domain-containing protein n=2 Tax=Desulfosalsimonas propionicica TaxID=332175 RepID=A0A7W0CBP5_9BACT|nr:hypothetical protein [Desulfosalsimonas propionicica]
MPIRKLSLLFTLFLFLSACASLGGEKQPHNINDFAHDFTLPDQDGNLVRLSDTLDNYQGAVIAFYPKDDSRN